MLDPVLEETMPVKNYGGIHVLEMGRDRQEKLVKAIKEELGHAQNLHIEPVLVVHIPELRPALSRLLQNYEMTIPVLSVYEVPASVPNSIIGSIKIDEE